MGSDAHTAGCCSPLLRISSVDEIGGARALCVCLWPLGHTLVCRAGLS